MLDQLFTKGPFRFEMRFDRGSLKDYYGSSRDQEAILRERRHWMRTTPGKVLAYRPEADPLLAEMVSVLKPGGEASAAEEGSVQAKEIGLSLEPDYLLLKTEGEEVRLVCGCVCFPSSWDLREKIGKSIDEIHQVVPGLNSSIGSQIGTFLRRIKPAVSWERVNWGLSRSPELNQHPARKLPKLDANVTEDEVFLRVEHQSLAALPKSQGILFGIRIKVWGLRDVVENSNAREGLLRSLETMPDEVAKYKNLLSCRQRVASFLREK